jgi:glycosyltransferase involved in cell wall biosynthesis
MRSKRPVIAIGIAFHSAAQKLSEAVDSALAQNVPGHDIQVLVLDSSPSGAARQLLGSRRSLPGVKVMRANARTAHAARNRLIAIAEARWPELRWHVRLDSDDRFASDSALAKALRYARPIHRAIVAGNRQLGPEDRLIGRNIPTRSLLSRRQLLNRLSSMAAGILKAELPSCNLILRAGLRWRYPAKKSAEDHWLLASLLLKMPKSHILVRQVEMVDYRVGGAVTLANRRQGLYLAQRIALLEEATAWHRDD